MTSLKRRSVMLLGLASAFLMVGTTNAEAISYYDVAPGVQLNVQIGRAHV